MLLYEEGAAGRVAEVKSFDDVGQGLARCLRAVLHSVHLVGTAATHSWLQHDWHGEPGVVLLLEELVVFALSWLLQVSLLALVRSAN